MKIACASLVLLATSSAAAAFVPSSSKQGGARFSLNSETGAAVTTEESSTEAVLAPPAPKDPFDTPQDLAGVVAPFGFFDPLNFAKDADAATMKRYREAEITHGRVGMLAVLGFLAGEFVEGSSFLFDAQISGPAITHLNQVPPAFWILLTVGIGASESTRLNIGWVDPKDVPVSKPGLLNLDYSPGDIGFDPLNLKPIDPAELKTMQTKELSNGRLAMLAAAGCMAQELANGQGILENLGISL